MKITTTSFEGLLILEPRVFEDSRGHFYEAYNEQAFQGAGIQLEFIQDNQSYSRKGVMRGLHYQKPPVAQTKLVRVLSGVIQDVVVDLRKSQPTFGQYYSIDLSPNNKLQLLIPKGFAHGFLVLSDSAEVLYKCDEYYHPEAEGGIMHNDSVLAIDWKLPEAEIISSVKDRQNQGFANTDFLF